MYQRGAETVTGPAQEAERQISATLAARRRAVAERNKGQIALGSAVELDGCLVLQVGHDQLLEDPLVLRVVAIRQKVVTGVEDADDGEVVGTRCQADVAAAQIVLHTVEVGHQAAQRRSHRLTGKAGPPLERDDVNEGHGHLPTTPAPKANQHRAARLAEDLAHPAAVRPDDRAPKVHRSGDGLTGLAPLGPADQGAGHGHPLADAQVDVVDGTRCWGYRESTREDGDDE
jgi:hypothetical protein